MSPIAQSKTTRFHWPEGITTAVLFNVAYEAWSLGSTPRTGPMGNPLPVGLPDTQALSWSEYGWKEGIWRLRDIFDMNGIKATVFASGCLAERARETIAALVSSGHEIAAHSYAQDVIPVALAEDAERANIARCHELLAGAAGHRISGWLSPRCTPSERTGPLLAEAGFAWHADCFDRDHPYVERYQTGRLVAVPFTMEVNDLPHYVRYGNSGDALVETFSKTLAYLRSQDPRPGHIDVTVHAHVSGRPYAARALVQMIEIAQKCSDVWLPTHAELVAWALSTEQRAATVGHDS